MVIVGYVAHLTISFFLKWSGVNDTPFILCKVLCTTLYYSPFKGFIRLAIAIPLNGQSCCSGSTQPPPLPSLHLIIGSKDMKTNV